MQKLMGDEGGGGGACFSLLTPSVCGRGWALSMKNMAIERKIGSI